MAQAKLQGSVEFPFSTLVQETIAAHGEEWAFEYYVRKGGLPRWEYRLFAGLACDDGMELPSPAKKWREPISQDVGTQLQVAMLLFQRDSGYPWEHFAH